MPWLAQWLLVLGLCAQWMWISWYGALPSYTHPQHTSDTEPDALAAELPSKPLPKPAPKPTPNPAPTSTLPRWMSRDPRTGVWVDYATAVSEKIESAHSQGLADMCVTVGTLKFTVSFREMRQYNEKGGSRPIMREVNTVSLQLR